ncbi:mediator complex subunit [Tulasnella sp. 332]|nr:mediator complex subunit [Tulasnella sp. 332]
MATISASDLTRTCVLSGVSAERVSLHFTVRTYIAEGSTCPLSSGLDCLNSKLLSTQTVEEWIQKKQHAVSLKAVVQLLELTKVKIVGSLLALLVSFPSSDLIQKYLEIALDTALIPLPVYISTFPDAILTSQDLQTRPALWPRLIALALKAHQLYSTESISPNASPPKVLHDSRPPARNADTIESVIKLLQLSYTFPVNQAVASASLFEQITQSLTTLLVLLLSAISSPSHARLPPTSTASLIQSVTDFAETYPLGDAKLGLESWVLSFSLASGAMAFEDNLDDFLGTDIGFGINEPQLNVNDDAPAASEANDIPVAEEDLVAPSSLIQSLVRQFQKSSVLLCETKVPQLQNRATRTHGPHCAPHAVSLLLATYRSTIIPSPAKPSNPTSSISPSTATQARGPTTIGPTTGGTPVRTPSGTGVHQVRTPANSSALLQSIQSSLGRTPTVPGANAGTPAPHSSAAQAHTPAATMAPTPAGRTPARTPGPNAKHSRTPTTQYREIRKPSQIRAFVFYEKLLVAAISLVAQEVREGTLRSQAVSDPQEEVHSTPRVPGLVEGFVLGKLPDLLHQFQNVASASSSSSIPNQPNLEAALEGALASVFTSHASLLDSCDPPGKGTHKRGDSTAADSHPSDDDLMSMVDGSAVERAKKDQASDRRISGFRRNLLVSLVQKELITARFARGTIRSGDCAPNSPSKAPDISREDLDEELQSMDRHDVLSIGDGECKIQKEAQEVGMDLLGYCDMKLSHDTAIGDVAAFLVDAAANTGCHAALSISVFKRWKVLVTNLDIEGLNTLAKVLSDHVAILDILSLHVPMAELVEESLAFLEDFDFDAVGDPQWALTLLGPIFLFVQLCIYQFGLSSIPLKRDDRKLSIAFLIPKLHVTELQSFSAKEKVIFKGWLEAVFAGDSSSEGISDRLFRTTPPRLLLRMAAPLFCEAIKTSGTDIEALRSGGVAYFLEPLLNWSLVGVIQGLVENSFRRGHLSTLNLQVIQTIVLDSNCPSPVIQMTGRSLLRLIDEPALRTLFQASSFDEGSVKRKIRQALSFPEAGTMPPVAGPSSLKAILSQKCQADYTTSPPPSLSGISVYPAKQVMDAIYATLMSVARAGPFSRSCRYLALSVICRPQPIRAWSPPLLPYFLNAYLLSLLPSLDHLSPTDRSLAVSVLAALASWSLLVSFRVEKALFDVKGVFTQLGPESGLAPSPDDMEVDEKSRRMDLSTSEVTNMARVLARKLKTAGGTSGQLMYQKVQAAPYFASNFPSFSTA